MIIKLYRKYLMHDMRQLAHRYALARFDKGEKREEAQASLDDSDVELMERFIHTGVGLLRKKLRKLLTKNVTDDDDKQENRAGIEQDEENQANCWEFALKEVDEEDVSVDGFAMAKMMHWFIVKWAMWQWLQMWSPTEASIAKSELEEMEEEIDDAIWDFNLAMPVKVHKPTPKYPSEETVIEFSYED